VDVALNNLQPYFKPGNVVEVMVGHYAGCCGWVIETTDKGLDIWMERSESYIGVYLPSGIQCIQFPLGHT